MLAMTWIAGPTLFELVVVGSLLGLILAVFPAADLVDRMATGAHLVAQRTFAPVKRLSGYKNASIS